jgi:hypothetical protein
VVDVATGEFDWDGIVMALDQKLKSRARARHASELKGRASSEPQHQGAARASQGCDRKGDHGETMRIGARIVNAMLPMTIAITAM